LTPYWIAIKGKAWSSFISLYEERLFAKPAAECKLKELIINKESAVQMRCIMNARKVIVRHSPFRSYSAFVHSCYALVSRLARVAANNRKAVSATNV
jgi:hypothetical protein